MTTGYSPAFLNFGRELNLPTTPPVENVQEEQLPLYAANLVSRLRRAIAKAKLRREEFKQSWADKFNVGRKDVDLPIGQKVWVRTHSKSDKQGYFAEKLSPRYSGPFEVVEKIGPVVYRLKDLRSGLIQKGLQHTNNLRLVIDGELSAPEVVT
jgi:hypothetical protein